MNNNQKYNIEKSGMPTVCPNCEKTGVWNKNGIWCSMSCYFNKLIESGKI